MIITRTICLAAGLLSALTVGLTPKLFAVQSDETTTAEYQGVYIRRPTLVVSDMDQALVLYRDILGLKLSRLKEDNEDSYVFTTFNIPAGTTVMHATLDTDTGARVLSLVEVKGIPPVSKDEAVRTAAILMNANGQMDRIRSRLIKEGYTVMPLHALGSTGREFAFLDQDGHLLALYEFPPR